MRVSSNRTTKPVRRKSHQIIVADWDGTMRSGFTLRDWMYFLANERVIAEKYPHLFDELLNRYQSKVLKYENFATDVLDLYAESIAGLSERKIEDHARDFVQKDIDNLFPFVRPLLEMARDKGIPVALVSGAPAVVLKEFAKQLGIEKVWGVEVGHRNGILQAKVIRDMAGAAGKTWALNQIKIAGYEILIALGDTLSDKPLLEAARFPFAIAEDDPQKTSRLLRDIAPIIAPSELMGELEGVL